MKLFTRIKSATQIFSKKALVITGTIAALAGIGAGFATAEFYPVRPVYDYNKGSASSNCADPNDPGYSGGRCGSLNGPVFNSFINTPSYGDERPFADARRTDQTAAGSFENVLTNVTDGSKEVIIRTYVHNNANQNTNASGVGVAKDTKVRILLPTGTANSLRARSYISASNASMVEDTVDFTATKNFHLEYIPGSATLYNLGVYKNGAQLSDSIVTTGALIGDDKMDGELPGCFDYASVVQIRVKVVPVTAPKVEFKKQVRIAGATTWGEEVSVKPGDTVQYLMTTTNTGDAQFDNAVVRDVMPPNMEIVKGTVKRIDATRNNVIADGPLFDGGFDLGSYLPGSGFYVMFNAKALGDFTGCTARVRNIGHVKTKTTPEQTDTADVVITKDNCTTVTKVVTCDALTAPSLNVKENEQVTFTAQATATNGAVVNTYQFLVNNVEVQNTGSSTYNFVKATAGDYTVKVVVKSSEGDRTSTACEKHITVTHEDVPVVRCDALTAPKLALKTGESTTFTAQGTPSFTTISGYIFKVNGTTVQDSAASTYVFTQNTEGTYTITVTVKSPIGNVTSEACAKNVVVQNEVVPIYSCDAMSFNKSSLLLGDTLTATVRYTAQGGASFKQAIFNFGDSTTYTTNNTTNGTVSADHVYKAKGNYAVAVKLEFTVNGQIKSVEGGNCVKEVNVTTEKCPIPGKEQYEKNDTEHCNDVKGVTTLPDTGAGSMIGLFAAVTAAGAFLHSVWTRRALRN